ncbi:hypothetical protein RJ641_014252 [Dillenia turbinata]|uniref:Uncharacterized protein n=1 Tax=Dillenia turbinata TaxID=194707 RepID=A0AAN8UTY4_9MAGN
MFSSTTRLILNPSNLIGISVLPVLVEKLRVNAFHDVDRDCDLGEYHFALAKQTIKVIYNSIKAASLGLLAALCDGALFGSRKANCANGHLFKHLGWWNNLL